MGNKHVLLIDTDSGRLSLFRTFLRIGIGNHAFRFPLIYSFETFARTNRPVYRTGRNTEFLLDFIQKFKGIIGIPVHFINKGKNRNPPHDAYFEQFSCLRLNAFGCVDNHDRRIRRHQRPISIFREILMPRRIQNVDAKSAIFKL